MFRNLTVSSNWLWTRFAQRGIEACASLVLMFGLNAADDIPAIAQPPARSNSLQTSVTATKQITHDSVVVRSFPSGIYLYGQSPYPNQIGSMYVVFEANQGNIVAALYMMRSSFDCAMGSIHDRQLELSVTDSYSGETYPVAIVLHPNVIVASSTGNPMISDSELQGLYRLPTVSNNDLRILNICKTAVRA